MDMSNMSKWMGPGLGGIMAGTEQRQIEEKRAADTQMTLQQIMASQGQEARASEDMVFKRAQEADRAAMAPLAREESQGRIKEQIQKITREEGKQGLEEFARIVGTPGWEETMQQEHPKFTKNPLFKAGIEAHKRDTMGYGPGERPEGPTQMEQLLERVGRTPASIEQRQREEATSRRDALKQAADQKKVETQQAGMRERLIMATQAKAELEEAKAAAKAARVDLSQDKHLVMLQNELHAAELKGDTEEMGRVKARLNQAKNIMMEIATAVNTEKGQNATARARALGITVPDYIPRANPTTPGATPTDPNSRTSPGGRKATVGPAPQKTSEAPAPNMLAQAADGVAAAILPSAQAAEAGQPAGGVPWGPPQQLPSDMPPMPAAMPNPGMAQPMPGAMPQRPPGNPRMGASPVDFPRVQPQEQMAMDQQSLQLKEQELAQFAQILQQTPKNHPKYAMMANLVTMLSREIAGMKQQRGL